MEAQVDWGGFKLHGQRISLFLMTLGWSRFSYGEFVDNERFETLRSCHEHAFDAIGGVAREVNMKTVVLKRNAYGQGLHRFHPGMHRSGSPLRVLASAVSPLSGENQG